MAQERWEAPLAAFIDEHCAMFASLTSPEDEASAKRLQRTEHPLALTTLHRQWQEIVETQTESALAEVGVTAEVFASLCERSALGPSARAVNKRVLDTLLAADDYASFALMMSRRNAQLEAHAARAIGQAVDGVSSHWADSGPPTMSADAAFADSREWVAGGNLDVSASSPFAQDAANGSRLTDAEVAALLAEAGSKADAEANSNTDTAHATPSDEDQALEKALDASLRDADRHRLEAERELQELEEALAASMREEEERIRRLQAEAEAATAAASHLIATPIPGFSDGSIDAGPRTETGILYEPPTAPIQDEAYEPPTAPA